MDPHRAHQPHPADLRSPLHDVGYPMVASNPLLENPKMDTCTRHSPMDISHDFLGDKNQRNYEKHHVSVVRVSPTVRPKPANVPSPLSDLLWQRVLVEHSYSKKVTGDMPLPPAPNSYSAYSVLQLSDKNAKIILTTPSTAAVGVSRTKGEQKEEPEAKDELDRDLDEESTNGDDADEEACRTSESTCHSASGPEDFNLDLDSETESITSASLISESDDAFHRTVGSDSFMKVSIPKKYFQHPYSSSLPSPTSSIASTDSNIRLRNGRILPATNLYLFASRKGPRRKPDQEMSKDDSIIEIPDDEKPAINFWEVSREKSELSSGDPDNDGLVTKEDLSSADESLVEEPSAKRQWKKRKPFYTIKQMVC